MQRTVTGGEPELNSSYVTRVGRDLGTFRVEGGQGWVTNAGEMNISEPFDRRVSRTHSLLATGYTSPSCAPHSLSLSDVIGFFHVCRHHAVFVTKQ